jgi:SET family sugar efflux transporter-like MFS transporter
MPGQAGCHHALYQYHPRWLDYRRFAGGVVAEIWSYHAVFWIALVMGVTQACLWRIKDV